MPFKIRPIFMRIFDWVDVFCGAENDFFKEYLEALKVLKDEVFQPLVFCLSSPDHEVEK